MSTDTKPFSPLGLDMFGNPIEQPKASPLASRFGVPPFSVLSAREGDWQDRKRAWIGLGIASELGRGDNALNLSGQCEAYRDGDGNYAKAPSGLARCYGQDLMKGENPNFAGRKTQPGLTWVGGNREWNDLDEVSRKILAANSSGTSIFDPVLCELCYRWFCPAGGQILDPFAGGSVRGIVASLMGYRYHGIDLRAEQIDANREQAAAICPDAAGLAWDCGDSLDRLEHAPEADFVFSCPPYGDLEVYSDDPRDLSTMEYHTFIANYKRIVLRAVAKLKQDRFACFVVGDFRDKRTGNYRNFVGHTVEAFTGAGCGYYNEAILLTCVGSLPIRVGKQFEASRKLGKTHQNVLVFVKGDGKAAAKAAAK
jgi:hypothetical protein